MELKGSKTEQNLIFPCLFITKINVCLLPKSMFVFTKAKIEIIKI